MAVDTTALARSLPSNPSRQALFHSKLWPRQAGIEGRARASSRYAAQ